MGTATSTGRRRLMVLGVFVILGVVMGPALAALAATSPPAGPPTADGSTAAALGAGWLVAQIDAGVPLQVFGSDDWGTTADAALALAATGVGGGRPATVWDAIVANRETVVAPDDFSGAPPFPDNPGSLAKVILLAHALGEDSRAVGSAPGEDLVARLEATLRTSGSDAGLYGAADPTYDGAYRQGLVLLALTTVGEPVPAAAIDWLTGQQCPNGSWIAYRPDTSVPCPTEGFPSPETNATASAVVGLVRSGSTGPVEPALDWLASVQNDDGGWGFLAGDGTDPNSTAVVLSALATAGVGDQGRFAGGTTALLSFQLGCADAAADRGSFTFPDTGGKANLYASVQAVAGALELPLPLSSAEKLVPGLPAVDCTTTTTSSTSTTSTTSTSTTSTTTTSLPSVTTSSTPAATVRSASEVASVTGSSSTTAASSGSTLALTGGEAGPPVATGLVLLVAGVLLMALRRRTGAR